MSLKFDPSNKILYNTESTDAWWQRRRKEVRDLLSDNHTNYTDNLDKLENLGDRIESIGWREREKEINFLQRNFPDITLDIEDKDLIQKLNQLLNGADKFQEAV